MILISFGFHGIENGNKNSDSGYVWVLISGFKSDSGVKIQNRE